MSKTITLFASYAAPASWIFPFFADPMVETKATGAKATGACVVGTKFTSYDKYASGKTLHVEKDALIVRTWRASNWKDDMPDTVLVIALSAKGEKTTVRISHAGVPDGEAVSLKKGWKEFYLMPLKKHVRALAVEAAGGPKKRGRPPKATQPKSVSSKPASTKSAIGASAKPAQTKKRKTASTVKPKRTARTRR